MLMLLVMPGRAWPDCRKADELVRRAADIAYQDDPAGKKALLEGALKNCSDHPEALNNMGVLLEGEGDLQQAMRYYRKALSIKPGMPEAWVGVGDVYHKQGQLPLALEAYLNACEKDEDAKERATDKRNAGTGPK